MCVITYIIINQRLTLSKRNGVIKRLHKLIKFIHFRNKLMFIQNY